MRRVTGSSASTFTFSPALYQRGLFPWIEKIPSRWILSLALNVERPTVPVTIAVKRAWTVQSGAPRAWTRSRMTQRIPRNATQQKGAAKTPHQPPSLGMATAEGDGEGEAARVSAAVAGSGLHGLAWRAKERRE
jgi:hypothetical protein